MAHAFRFHRFDLLFVVLAGAVVWLALASTKEDLGGFEPPPSDPVDGDFRPLGWKDLRLLDLERGEVDPRLVAFDGQLVRVPGYIVPLEDYQARTSHFLLVPYVGACIHSPPPPANQIVAVQMVDGPVAFEMWETYWISGRLFIEEAQSPYGAAAFHMRGLGIEPFEAPE
ncbi:MAG: DUF3299 domain-containing protein [Acidobacteria bacterium]|nr:DUF3299 domain-containing protein [Acidobacteriota bacterium]